MLHLAGLWQMFNLALLIGVLALIVLGCIALWKYIRRTCPHTQQKPRISGAFLFLWPVFGVFRLRLLRRISLPEQLPSVLHIESADRHHHTEYGSEVKNPVGFSGQEKEREKSGYSSHCIGRIDAACHSQDKFGSFAHRFPWKNQLHLHLPLLILRAFSQPVRTDCHHNTDNIETVVL